MLDKYRLKLSGKIGILVCFILISFMGIRFAYSIFHTDSNGSISNKIAFYVLDAERQTQSIKIGDLSPDGQDFSYDIEVANYLNGKVSEVDLDYTLNIVTTTNIPVSYKLYKNNGNTDVIGNKEIIQDSNMMYFFKYSPQVGSFVHGVTKRDVYTLVVNFPQMYNKEKYQDLIETIEITVDASQV